MITLAYKFYLSIAVVGQMLIVDLLCIFLRSSIRKLTVFLLKPVYSILDLK